MLSFSKGRKFMLKLTGLEDHNCNHIILALTLYLLLAEKFLVHMFGRMVLKKLLNKLILTSLTSKVYQKKKKEKLKIKLTELSIHAVKLAKVLWINQRQRKYMDSVYIKVEWFQEIH
jgi:hypothetical protein